MPRMALRVSPGYPGTENLVRHYDSLEHFSDGIIVLGEGI
jgi:hypothetical protein